MDMVFRFGLMVLNIKASGKTIKLMDRENSGILTMIFFKVNFLKIEQMGLVFTFILMAQNMREIGRMIYSKGLVK